MTHRSGSRPAAWYGVAAANDLRASYCYHERNLQEYDHGRFLFDQCGGEEFFAIVHDERLTITEEQGGSTRARLGPSWPSWRSGGSPAWRSRGATGGCRRQPTTSSAMPLDALRDARADGEAIHRGRAPSVREHGRLSLRPPRDSRVLPAPPRLRPGLRGAPHGPARAQGPGRHEGQEVRRLQDGVAGGQALRRRGGHALAETSSLQTSCPSSTGAAPSSTRRFTDPARHRRRSFWTSNRRRDR